MKTNVMRYEETGTVKSKSRNINYFRDLSSSQIVGGTLKELYRRYQTELYAVAFFSLLAWDFYNKIVN